ncbi:HetP family heterocyst commitment protein [Nostoc sp. PA-18-2419]|uniref:HetP family heterocyst commitment protein n=1 Tax=Nostoc sp. PA-18-2419 TaxID=2575443 RepID=UPI001109D13C|nr:HetP family heterocyst commitment protein [Nostoc sp. PA-18-2419]
MAQQLSESDEILTPKFHFNHEELEHILRAVTLGKYSWACVLILRFISYDPLKYIPSRTYIRLIKSNCLLGKINRQQADTQNFGLLKLESTWIQQGYGKRSSK